MLLTHAVALAEARTYLAALADQAATPPACEAYERTLLYLDAVHADAVPALDAHGLLADRAVLRRLTEAAIQELLDHGLDPLQVELLLAMLADASRLDTEA